MKNTKQTSPLGDLTREDIDFLALYEWKRNKQKEVMTEILGVFRSHPEVPRSLFVNAWKVAQAYAFKDENLEQVAEDQENSKKQVLEWTEVVGQK